MKQTFVTMKGKNLGVIDHKKSTYTSPRNVELHYFRKFNGFGVSIKVLDLLLKEKIETIIIDLGLHKLETYTANFFCHGIEWMDGEDQQFILEMKYWKGSAKFEKEIQSKL